MNKIKKLELSNNAIRYIPQFSKIQEEELEELILSDNKIQFLEGLLKLKKLKKLDLSRDFIASIDFEEEINSSLEELVLTGNPIVVSSCGVGNISNNGNSITMQKDNVVMENVVNERGLLEKLRKICFPSLKILKLHY